MITFPATGDDRNQASNQGYLGDVPQVQTRADIEKLPAQTSTPAIRRSDNSDDMLRIRNIGHPQKEHERMIQSTQRKMLRLIVQTKRRYKKIVQRKDETNDKGVNDDLGQFGWRECRWTKLNYSQRPGEWRIVWEWYWGRNWHYRDWRGRLDWLHIMKHRRSHGKDGKCEDSMLEPKTHKKNENGDWRRE